jgi:hypothetical protein
MVVGGYAVNFDGYERNTSDLDIWVKSTPENIYRICSALKQLNFEDEALQHLQKFNLNEPSFFILVKNVTIFKYLILLPD